MITIVTVWLCLITHVACDVVITVNNNGSDNDKCCVNGTCPCSSLSSALHDVSDSTVINITSESVTLHDIVGMGSGDLNNITITGNGATIMCNNAGGVYCESCSDITIMGITWYQCGHNDSAALAFISLSSEILIQDCIFQNSSVHIQNAQGSVSINKSNFISDVFHSNCSYSGLHISYDTKIVVAISNSWFDGSGCIVGCISSCTGSCTGIWIKPSIDVFEFNQFLFRNTKFSNYEYGLDLSTSGENAAVELHNVNVYNNIYGIFIDMNRSTNGSSGTVDVLSGIFMDNYHGLTIIADTVNVASNTFTNNRDDSTYFIANIVSITCVTFTLGNSIVSSAYIVNISSVTFVSNPLQISTESHDSSVSIDISNSYFYNNSDKAILIDIYDVPECTRASIIFTNVLFYNTIAYHGYIHVDTSVLYIDTENTVLSAVFKNVSFISNYLAYTLYINSVQNDTGKPQFCYQIAAIEFANCTFDENFALEYVVAMNIIGDDIIYNLIDIELSDCNFDNNFVGKSILYVNIILKVPGLIHLSNSRFSNNNGTVLQLVIDKLFFNGNVLFINNSAINGAAVYVEKVHAISFDDNSIIQFINNSAKLRGGAMYINLVDLDTDIYPYCDVFNSISNTSKVSFTNNSAGIAGNSIYFSIPQSCQIVTDVHNVSSLLYYPNMFNYSEPVFTKNSPVVTSPYNIKLYTPAIPIHNSDNDYFIQGSKMLGEPIQITASVLDYFSKVAEPVTFFINCKTCDSKYILSTYLISVHNQSIYELKVLPTVAKDVISNTNVSMTFLSALLPIYYRQINVSLSIELSSCRAGYLFNNTQRQCVCYPHHDIVHCKGYYVEIKIGYWIGYLTGQHTSSVCPNNYCSSEHTETSPGYYSLRGKSDDQCSSHRTGVACGECKSGYTLAYDSPDCINTDKCSAGMTFLVIVLTILYWIAIVAVVFGLMYFQFQISSGYAYGIIYYYSIVDILLVNDVSKEVFQLVFILSSFANLTPRLFGQLCLVEGLSGIDQQFIHYSHALAVSLILLIIVLVARYSPRLTRFVGRCIIRVICILLLLSYTSLASTSLQLLRPLIFNDVDEVRTYSSPDIKYFTGRHLVYAIVAILCEVIIVIGLPLFLLLEPFLRRRVNLVRIKPLLDQFQGCYKDKYRWFAAYYLICRQVIILIVYVGNGNYYYMLYGLQTVCVIIAMIHGCVHPYNNNLLNVLDEVILVILVLVVNLNLFSLSSFIPTNYFSVALVILPLLVICFIAIRKLISHFFIRKKRELQLYNPVGTLEGNDGNNERR